MYYAHQYIDENTYQIAKYFDNGDSQNVSPNDFDYLKWIADGNILALEAKGRFLSIVNGVVVVDPNKDAILAAEEAARAAKAQAQVAKAQAFFDNLPSWAIVDQAVTDISDLPSAKAFIRKLARIVYWLARDQ